MGDENNSQFDELYELLQENFPTAKIEKDELPISLAIYTGKKSIGISFGLDWKTVLYNAYKNIGEFLRNIKTPKF